MGRVGRGIAHVLFPDMCGFGHHGQLNGGQAQPINVIDNSRGGDIDDQMSQTGAL
jgi:hypothetical protein